MGGPLSGKFTSVTGIPPGVGFDELLSIESEEEDAALIED